MAFQEFDYDLGYYTWHGFENFKEIFSDFKTESVFKYALNNSSIVFLFGLLFGSTGAILFSYYIFKNYPASLFFKILLYVPHIISSVVTVIMYKFFVEVTVPEIYMLITGEPMKGLIANADTRQGMIIFFSIWISWGTNVLLYSGTMSSISDSVIESGQLEGITPTKELILIVLPLIWPTFVTFMVVSVTGFFTNQMNLYSFYGPTAPSSLHTFGYYLYAETLQAGFFEYPYLSAIGMLMTAIAIPLTLLVRWLLTRFGPSVE
jgi:ABC-type sugar transport system permease subunit